MGCELCKVTNGDIDDLDGATIAIGGAALKETMGFLSKIDLFRSLAQEDLTALARICTKETFNPSDTLVKQGDLGDCLYCISKGLAKATVNGNEVASLMPGDYFGEDAITRGARRAATVVAETACTALKITKRGFQEMSLLDKIEIPERHAVVGGRDRPVVTKPPDPKTASDRTLMMKAIKNNENLATFCKVDDKLASKMIDVAWKETVPQGKALIKEGDFEADYFYIIQEGSFDVTTAPQKGQALEKSVSVRLGVKNLNKLGPGESFGELALLYFTPRRATVTASVNSVVWVIDRTSFKKALASGASEEADTYLQSLEAIEEIRKLKDDEKKKLANQLLEISFVKGESVFVQGEEGTTFYLLLEGKASVVKDGKETQVLEATPGSAKCFGQEALKKNAPRNCTVTIISDTAKAVYMDKASFDMLIEGEEAFVKKTIMQQKITLINTKESTSTQTSPKEGDMDLQKVVSDNDKPRILFKELNKLGVLGTGGFGLVELVEHVKTKDIYALKSISKGFVVKSGMQKGVMDEKSIQFMCDSNFIIKLYETYSNDQTLFLLLEPALGGELFRTYKNKKLAGSATHARYYSASVLFALEHLHSKKVIYRDLKPENVLLNDKGQVKLTDMGLAKVSPGKTYTTCGTPEYFAPEVIWATGYTHAADWWTLGVFIFELMAGHTPFEAPEPMQIYSNVFKGIKRAKFPECMKGPCKEIVLELCQEKAMHRLPMKKGGTANIKNHTWYSEINWNDIKNLAQEPPYKPVVRNKKDLTNFLRSKPPKPPKVIEYQDDGSGWDAEFATSY